MPLLCLEGNSNRVDTSFEIHIFSFTALCGLYLNFRPRYREQVFFFFFFFFIIFVFFCCFLGIVFCFEFVVRRIYPFLGFFFIHVILAYLAQKTKKKKHNDSNLFYI
jgi:apolipoprotein N-acyltransferase